MFCTCYCVVCCSRPSVAVDCLFRSVISVKSGFIFESDVVRESEKEIKYSLSVGMVCGSKCVRNRLSWSEYVCFVCV